MTAPVPAYELLRSRRRTLALEVTADCRVVVRAPMRLAKARIDQFAADHAVWIETHLARQQARRDSHPEPTEAEREACIRQAQALLPARVAHYSAIMGLKPTALTVTGARKRFGSCSPKNRLCFSWRLMQYPPEAIDYVVVHELAHIRHKNHSPAFYDCVAQVLPDWRARRELLKS